MEWNRIGISFHTLPWGQEKWCLSIVLSYACTTQVNADARCPGIKNSREHLFIRGVINGEAGRQAAALSKISDMLTLSEPGGTD